MSFKGVVKAGSGTTIRVASYLLPASFLFYTLLLLRRLDTKLKRAAPPAWLLRMIDHLFYSMRPVVMESRLGDAKFFIRLNDPCHYDHLLGLHEPKVVEWLSAQLKNGMTFVDVGANIGFYTLLAAQRVGAEGTVLSVEADPEVAAILRRTIEANALRNVRVVHGAAYRTCGQVRLGRARASSWYTGLYYEKAAQWIAVPAYTMDLLVRQEGASRVNLVKIDVEGAEEEVLEGMERILREDRPRFLIELHDYRSGGGAHPAVQQLKSAGYCVSPLTEAHIVAEPAGRGA